MMKQVLLVFLSMLSFVHIISTDVKRITSNGRILYYENSPATFICKHSNATWLMSNKKITECNCPMTCEDILFNKTRITAYCNGSSPVLHFKQMKLIDNSQDLRCAYETYWRLQLLVGRRNDDFYPKEPFALINNTYSLVCERNKEQHISFYEEKKIIGWINSDNSIGNLDKGNFSITNNQLLIKKIDLKDDGKIFGCSHSGRNLSLLNLTVNVPVSSVSLHQESKGLLLEDEIKTFVCKVDESKPKASFQWFLFENRFEREITQNIDITSKQNGKLWQTTSTLKLKLKRNFKKIKCRARIQGMDWTNSTSLPLDILYYPIIKMPDRITVIENETKELNCISEGNPKPTNKWRIGNKVINSTSLRISFTRQNSSGGIECIAIANTSNYSFLKTVKKISILVTYPPEITISYEKTKNEISCSADASPSNITYELVQKWGNIEKRKIYGNKIVFQNLNYQDAGDWICQANNGVPTKTGKKYSEKSIQVKDNIQAKFIGGETQKANIGDQKNIKVCFYCHPEAEVVEWHNEHGKLSSDKSVYSFAEDGQFPFTGNCSILTLEITENSAKNYELIVQNVVGKSKYTVTLDIKTNDDNNKLVIILSTTITAVLIFIIISGGIIWFKYKSNSMKKKAAMRNRPLPAKPELDIYENDYDTLDLQQKADKPTRYVYENHEALEKDEQKKHTYKNIEMQQKGEPAKHI